MMQIAFSDSAKDDAVTQSLRMHPEQSPVDLGLMRHAPPPPGAGVNTATGTPARSGTWWDHLRERASNGPNPRGADHGART
jgi:hypothetical protein